MVMAMSQNLMIAALAILGAALIWLKVFKIGSQWKAVTLLLLGVGLVFANMDLKFIDLSSAGTPAPQTPAVQTQVVAQQANCPTTLTTSEYFRVRDTAASTLTFMVTNPPYLLKVADNIMNTGTVGTSAGYSAANTVSCGTPYKLYLVTASLSNASASSAVSEVFTPVGATSYQDLTGVRLAAPTVRVKDGITDSYFYHLNGGASDGAGTPDLLNTTSYYTVNDMDAGGTSAFGATAVAADGIMSFKVYMKANTSNYFVGEPGLPVIMCVDSGTANAWQEPSVSFDGGAKLSNVKGSLNSVDQTGTLVSASEWCYQVVSDGARIGDTEHFASFDFKARSGVNPGTSDDIVVSILPVGRYYSSLTANSVKEGIYSDAATQLLVVAGSAITPTITFPVT